MKSLFIAAFFVALYMPSAAQNAGTPNKSLQPLFTFYNELKNALVKDDAQTAASNAAQFVNTIENTDIKKLAASEQSTFTSLKENLRNNAKRISEVKRLEHQREHFAALSKDMFTLAQSPSS